MTNSKTWHDLHKESLGFGQRLADKVANGMGSWRFIIIQSLIVLLWMALNVVGFVNHWDVYPYILLNLVFSTQAAYAAPIIMRHKTGRANVTVHRPTRIIKQIVKLKKK